MSHEAGRPVKVAVLGGGIGGLTTALALTDPERRDRYEVTVYQMGFRLGGKGASGRNAECANRIEEHGIHVWFGFYENAFKLLRGCYDSLAAQSFLSPDAKAPTLSQCIAPEPGGNGAFYPHHDFVVNERYPDDHYAQWSLHIPPNNLVPGDGGPVEPEQSMAFNKIAQIIASIEQIRAEGGNESLPLPGEVVQEDEDEKKFHDLVSKSTESAGAENPDDFLKRALDGLAAPGLDDALAGSFEGIGDPERAFRLRIKFTAWALRAARVGFKPWSGKNERTRRLYLSLDTAAAMATGLARDVFARGSVKENLDALDELDLRAWLVKHGADRDHVANNPTVRFVYNSAFAFEDGDPAKPLIAAGAALRGMLRLFLTYKGAFAYRLSSGMGDVVFSPIYALLKKRGVHFKFFHRIDRLLVGEANGRPVIDGIEFTEQAAVKNGNEYDPIVWINDFPCWPSRPRCEQMVDGQDLEAAIQQGLVNLEDPGSSWKGGAPPATLRRGEHFDEVVLGIPVGALGPVTQELRRHPTAGRAWSQMLDHVKTTPTQAFQLWFRASLQDLGWDAPAPVFGTYRDPIDTYIDMTPALRMESKREGDVKNLSYFCGVYKAEPGESHSMSMDRAIDNAVDHLKNHCSYIWPNLRRGEDFRWSLLFNGSAGGTDRERFLAGQYARANVLPSERYVLSLPGTNRYRLAPDVARGGGSAAFANLWLTGDWTQNPVNLGCVEATVMAGLIAARGLSGDAIPIIGEDDDFLFRSLGRGTRVLSSHESLRSPAMEANEARGGGAWDWGDAVAELQRAAGTYDNVGVAAMCTALLDQVLRHNDAPRPERAEKVLSILRGGRYFELTERVAEAFLEVGLDLPLVRRQYAQAMIEQGRLYPAIEVLKGLAEAPNVDIGERKEAWGLIGRVHKQRYVREGGRARSGELAEAIAAYRHGYELGDRSGWHAANLIALLERARRDGQSTPPDLDSRALAETTIASIKGKPLGQIDAWDRAILVEAHLALGQKPQSVAALRWHLGVPDEDPDAFAVGALLRQLVEVWELRPNEDPGATMIPMLQAELLGRQGGRLQLGGAEVSTTLQRVLGTEQTVTMLWYCTGLERCRLVGRVLGPFENGGGTGFLVRAGDFLSNCPYAKELVLLTNEHVLSPAPRDSSTLSPNDARVRFEAAPPPDGRRAEHRIREIVWSRRDLDSTIARLDPAPEGAEPYPFAPSAPDRSKKGRFYAIGHAGGGALSLSLHDNLFIDWDDPFVHYRCPTEPGSSGSPVFDHDWNLVALHHAGGMAMPRLRGEPGVYPANEGIWIEAVRRASRG